MKKLRVGVIGTGDIAKVAHLPNYKKIEDVELAACADIDLTAAKKRLPRSSRSRVSTRTTTRCLRKRIWT
jgi:predicted dehydrogenase